MAIAHAFQVMIQCYTYHSRNLCYQSYCMAIRVSASSCACGVLVGVIHTVETCADFEIKLLLQYQEWVALQSQITAGSNAWLSLYTSWAVLNEPATYRLWFLSYQPTTLLSQKRTPKARCSFRSRNPVHEKSTRGSVLRRHVVAL